MGYCVNYVQGFRRRSHLESGRILTPFKQLHALSDTHPAFSELSPTSFPHFNVIHNIQKEGNFHLSRIKPKQTTVFS